MFPLVLNSCYRGWGRSLREREREREGGIDGRYIEDTGVECGDNGGHDGPC